MSVSGTSKPRLPSPDWHLFSDVEAGYALAVPPKWEAFVLSRQFDTAVSDCPTRSDAQTRAAQFKDLQKRGVIVFLCDTSSQSDAIGYVLRGKPPGGDLEEYVRSLPQSPGRVVEEVRKTTVPTGEMVIALKLPLSWSLETLTCSQALRTSFEFDGRGVANVGVPPPQDVQRLAQVDDRGLGLSPLGFLTRIVL